MGFDWIDWLEPISYLAFFGLLLEGAGGEVQSDFTLLAFLKVIDEAELVWAKPVEEILHPKI